VAGYRDACPVDRVLRFVGGAGSLFGKHRPLALSAHHAGAPAMALDVLMTLVAVLVIYLFYAVIHPEKF
jgi:K+-transporting ATPase KdpF subunit